MNTRYILFFLFCCCFISEATAQQFPARGVIYKKSSPERVAEVLISNLSTKEVRISDNFGQFQIPAKPGDTLLFKKLDFAPLSFVIYGASDITIFLQPAVLLKQVTIAGQSKKQEVADVMSQYRKHGSYYTLTPSVWSVMNSPLTGLYELFGKEPNQARRFQKMTREEMEQSEIHKRYNIPFVKKILAIEDDKEAQAFMDAFTPAYEDIKTWNDYELISYTKRSYEYYKKNKGAFKLPKLY